MRHILPERDRSYLDSRIADAEKLTGAQIVLAVVRKSDSYPEIPWIAFASGSSVACLAVFLTGLLAGQWITGTMILYSVAAILTTGIIASMVCLLIPGAARLFLQDQRKDTETMQYAQSIFLDKELFLTEGRRGILLFISQFERKVVIIPDRGIRNQLSLPDMKRIISKMHPALKGNDLKKALETGLDAITESIRVPNGSGKNELSDKIIGEDDL